MNQPLRTQVLDLPDESATDALGGALAFAAADLQPDALGALRPGPRAGGRIHLQGDLGAGKTALARALIRTCGVTGRIKSPSYALLESYKVFNLYLYHLDFYRFSDSREWLDAGFRDILQENAIVLIEWPEQAGDLLPPPDLDIHIEHEDEGRSAVLTAYSDKGSLWLTTLFPAKATPRPPTPAGDA